MSPAMAYTDRKCGNGAVCLVIRPLPGKMCLEDCRTATFWSKVVSRHPRAINRLAGFTEPGKKDGYEAAFRFNVKWNDYASHIRGSAPEPPRFFKAWEAAQDIPVVRGGEADCGFPGAEYPSQPHPVIPRRVAPQRCPSPFHRTGVRMADLPVSVKGTGFSALQLKNPFEDCRRATFWSKVVSRHPWKINRFPDICGQDRRWADAW